MSIQQKTMTWAGLAAVTLSLFGCQAGLAPVREDALAATVVTEPTPHDTDDPAIWINAMDRSRSLILGTDKDSDGGLYAYDLDGKIVNKVTGLKRPNNVDVAYGLAYGDTTIDIAVLTERETNSIRVFQLPGLTPIDNGGIPVFVDEAERAPMGIALYTRAADSAIFAVVGRKSGPEDGYLWQYRLDGTDGQLRADFVRKFGNYSGQKEIEAIAVDNELGYVYYSDEGVGVRKYEADPDKGNNEELAWFGQEGFKNDHEGIAIYKSSDSTGYILVSNQQANTFMVYPREGASGQRHQHELLVEIPLSTIECDGADVTAVALSPRFPNGVFVAMSNGMIFHYYDWTLLQQWIDAARQ